MTAEPVALAKHAAATIHNLVHVSRPAITPLTIANLYAITGEFDQLTAALAQTLNQLARYLSADTPDATPVIDQLGRARITADQLNAAIDAAHETLGDLAEQPPRAQGVNFQPALTVVALIVRPGVSPTSGGDRLGERIVQSDHRRQRARLARL